MTTIRILRESLVSRKTGDSGRHENFIFYSNEKTYLFLLGVLGLMASSCEEKIEPALPQQNPQQPIVAVEDVTSAKAGVLASDAVLNLESYNTPGAMVPVMKLEKADSPSGRGHHRL